MVRPTQASRYTHYAKSEGSTEKYFARFAGKYFPSPTFKSVAPPLNTYTYYLLKFHSYVILLFCASGDIWFT